MGLLNEISKEVKGVIGGKTIGAIFPPIVYAFVNSFAGLTWGLASAVATAVFIGVARYLKGETIRYALGGLIGVIIASGFAYYAGNAANYFLPRVITSGFLFLVAIGSLIIGKPMAAIASHLSRGWEISWFMRKDIKPAYIEVTIGWAGLFLFRMFLQIILLRGESLLIMAWANILLGFPATLLVLVATYIYGIWRLKKLGGPGIDEYREGLEPPWRGQIRGF